MGVKISGAFFGELGTRMRHLPSGTELVTEPPVDNGGRGTSFSPTDLLATAYGSCMMSVAAIRAKKEGWDLEGMTVDVEKHMSSSMPRKVAALDVHLTLPARLTPQQREILVDVAKNCPVALSVSPEITINFSVTFN